MAPLKSSVKVRRTRNTISLDLKMNILNRLESGEKVSQISSAMNLAKSTIQTVRDNREKIKASLQSAGSRTAGITRNRPVIMTKMESLLVSWIEGNVNRLVPMSQIMVQEKAKSIFEKLKENSSENMKFDASKGWFDRFKKRHNIQNIKPKREGDDNCHTDTPIKYPHKFINTINDKHFLCKEEISANETDSPMKRMTANSFMLRDEQYVPEHKSSNELYILPMGAKTDGNSQLQQSLTVKETSRALKSAEAAKLNIELLKKCIGAFETALSDLQNADLITERSVRTSINVNLAIQPYKELLRDMQIKAKQPTLESFFKPRKS